MPIFLIDTLSTFRIKYAIEAETLEHAYDELVMTEHSRTFDELTQKWLGEQVLDGREVTVDDIKAEIERLKEDKDEMCSHWMEDELIHKVDYNENTSSE
jgi:hypothetical protein